ncbi:hypothetical protein U3516DRAFT_533911, partial [Neocallimastix sp. 'constans']
MEEDFEEKQKIYKQIRKLLIHGVNLIVLKEIIEKNNITPKDFRDFSELLGIAIKFNASLDIIEYFINHRKGKTLNFNVKVPKAGGRYIIMTPLMIAVANNKFKMANFLIKKGANINYGIIKNVKYYSIIDILFESKDLNKKNLKYILKNGFSLKRITEDLIFEIIHSDSSSLLKIILEYWKFDNFFILNLLTLYKNGEKVSKTQFQNLIAKEDNKIPIIEDMYLDAIYEKDIDVLETLFMNDCCNKERVIKRIIKYNLLEISVASANRHFIFKILHFTPLTYRNVNYINIL